MRHLPLGTLLLCSLFACGDDAGSDGAGGSGAGATTSSTGTQTTSSATGATSSSTSTGATSSTTTGGQGGADCATIFGAVDAALANAKGCNPLIDIEQCTQTLEGPCCPTVVNPANAGAIQQFQDAMADLAASGCGYPCPDIVCIEDPVGVCGPETSSCTEMSPN